MSVPCCSLVVILVAVVVSSVQSVGTPVLAEGAPAAHDSEPSPLISKVTVENLVGVWERENGSSLQFFPDGAYIAKWHGQTERGLYAITESRLTMNPQQDNSGHRQTPPVWQLALVGNKLTLAGSVNDQDKELTFYKPAATRPIDCDNGAVGVGLTLAKGDDQWWVVKKVEARSVAAQKGIRVGHILLSVDDRDSKTLTACEIAKLLTSGATKYAITTFSTASLQSSGYTNYGANFDRSVDPLEESRLRYFNSRPVAPLPKSFKYECPKCGLTLTKEGVGWYKCPIDGELMTLLPKSGRVKVVP